MKENTYNLVFHTGEKSISSKYISSNYIVVSKVKLENIENSYSINSFELPISDIRDKSEEFRNNALDSFKNSAIESIIKSNFNNFYNHIIVETYKWINAFNQITKIFRIENVIITDGIDSEYCPYYEAEGEINKKLYYKSYDFIPKVILNCIRLEGYEANFINRHSKIKLWLRIFIRRYLLLHIKLFLQIRKKVKSRQKRKVKALNSYIFFFFTRGLAHTHFFLPYIEKYTDSILVVSDGYNSGYKNIDFCKKNDLSYVNMQQYISYSDIFRAYFASIKSLIKNKKKKTFSYKNMTLNFNSALNEMIISNFDLLIYKFALENLTEEIQNIGKIVFITGEMLTIYPTAVSSISEKHKKIKSLQLQTTGLNQNPQTSFVACDNFLFNSLEDYQQYKILNPIQNKKYDYWGSLMDNSTAFSNKKLKKILFYSQPIEKEIEIEILEFLVDYVKNKNIQLFLKPHPRDKINYINSWKSQYIILDKDHHIDSYISKIDLVLTRHSSISQNVILKGIPIIFCLFTESFQRVKASYIKRDYSGVCYNFNNLIDCLNNYESLQQDFKKMRSEYIYDSGLDKDINYFNRKLREYRSEI